MAAKKEVKEVFNLEILGYKKSEVDELVNTLGDRIEILTKDVEFLKKELGKFYNREGDLLKRTDK